MDDSGELLVSVDAPGSGMYVDLSRDGELLFAGRRVIGVFPLVDGELQVPLPLPAAPQLAGSIAHYQALLFDDESSLKKFTNKVSVRFLP